MAILIDAATRILVHNPTAGYARGMTEGMVAAGSCVVGGVSPGRGGQTHEGVPVFDTAEEAVRATGANTAVLWVPAAGVADAIVEHVDAGIRLIMAAAEYVPVHDAMRALSYARSRGAWVIGPNSVGLVAPGVGVLSALSPSICTPGTVGVMSRSGTMTMAVTRAMNARGIGQSTVISIGGDAVIGRNPAEYARLFEADPDTRVIVSVSEIGGAKEYQLVAAMPELTKPVVALVLGRFAPPARRMGHAGALVSTGSETAQAKREAMRAAGIHIADNPYHLADLVGQLLERR